MQVFCFTKISVFLSTTIQKIPYYYQIHEFLDLEVLDVPTSKLFENFNLTKIAKQQLIQNKSYFAKLDAKCPDTYTSKRIVFQKDFRVLNYNQHLFTLFSSNFKFRCIMKINV